MTTRIESNTPVAIEFSIDSVASPGAAAGTPAMTLAPSRPPTATAPALPSTVSDPVDVARRTHAAALSAAFAGNATMLAGLIMARMRETQQASSEAGIAVSSQAADVAAEVQQQALDAAKRAQD